MFISLCQSFPGATYVTYLRFNYITHFFSYNVIFYLKKDEKNKCVARSRRRKVAKTRDIIRFLHASLE